MQDNDQRHLAIWLFTCCALVLCMVLLGGATRLTGSGLSIVHWKPISGVIPPLNAEQWQKEFEHYQQSPEFKHINSHMEVADFKSIYWFEYSHRLLGRSIGLAFLIPFLIFLAKRKISKPVSIKLIGIFLLGGLQGGMGWYMVKSGLIDNPHVSQYRLVAHLMLALIIYAYMLWIALDLSSSNKQHIQQSKTLFATSATLLVLATTTLLAGGFVAGLKAGLIFNTFPLMGNHLIPEDMYTLNPWYINWFENLITVQFNHRLLALVTFSGTVIFWVFSKRFELPKRSRLLINLVLVAVSVQTLLGILTLLLKVPVILGVLHQAGAFIFISALLITTHNLYLAGKLSTR